MTEKVQSPGIGHVDAGLYKKNCIVCSKEMFRKSRSEALRPNWRFCSRSCCTTYLNLSKNPMKQVAARKKVSDKARLRWKERYNWLVEKIHNPESVRKRALTITGAGHWNWQGGKTDDARRQRNSAKYRDWRKSVFERDDYTCQSCLTRGGKLNADHIFPFAWFPELRFNVNNGRTLCLECHKKTDTFACHSASFNKNRYTS